MNAMTEKTGWGVYQVGWTEGAEKHNTFVNVPAASDKSPTFVSTAQGSVTL